MSDALAAIVWSNEQKDLIKKTVATDATDAELAMFLHIASKAGLDPLQKQIHFTKRQGRVTVIAAIDGLRARAARERDFKGILSGVVCQKDDFEFDATVGRVVKHIFNAFGDRGPIKGAWATVEREGMLPFTALVRFEEFNQPQSPTWRQMPSVMISKVSESTALRKAYPEQFGSIYERAEMSQAGVPDEGEKEVSTFAPKKGAEAVRAALGPATVTVEPPLQAQLEASIAVTRKLPSDETISLEAKRALVDTMRAALESKPNARNAKSVREKLLALEAEISDEEFGPEPLPEVETIGGHGVSP